MPSNDGPGRGGVRHPAPKKKPKPKPATPAPVTAPATPAQDGAFDQMMLVLREYGLEALGDVLRGLILDGITDEASLTLALQDTDEWKRRFSGNERLRAAGLPVLSVAEYLSTERSYAQVLKNYGLPEGFYDDPADFAGFIGGSVSPSELQSRAQMFSDIAKRDDPAIRQQLTAMGLTEGDILAYTMDPSKAMPLIERKYRSTLIGAAGRRNGLAVNEGYAGHLSDIGITEEQAIQGYGTIAENLGDLNKLGDIYGEDYGQSDLESEVFEANGNATKKRKRLASRERGEFGGTSGVGDKSLARQTGGQY